MQRQRNSIAVRERVHGRTPRRLDPVVGDAVPGGLLANGGILRVEEHLPLRVEKIVLVRHRRRRLDAIGVVEHQADVADAPDAGLSADRG